METLLADLGDFIRTHHAWAGPVVALISFGESLVLVGVLIPATAVMLLIGGLVGAGVLDATTVLVAAVIGAVLGDVVSYALGRWLGPGIVHRRPLRRYRPAVARTRLFFRRYGFAAVLLGRFLGPIRSTVPLVAGMMAMDQKRFQLANVLSAILWAPIMLAPGWLGARGMEQVPGVGGGHMLAALGLVLAVTVVATLLGGKRLLARTTNGRDATRAGRRELRAALARADRSLPT
jgi:membrane protein DedA with SNARE-associated domain